MKKIGVLLLGIFALLPAYAQDPPPADAAAPADAAPADAAPASTDAAAPAEAAAPDTAATPAVAEAQPADAAAAPAEPAADTAAAPADASTATASGEAAPAEAAPAEGAAAEPAATETAAAEAAPAGSQSERKPWDFYVGYDYTHMNMLITTPNPPTPSAMQTKFGGDFFTTNFHQVRGGVRLFDVVGLEAHYGFKSDDGNKAGKISMKNYGGLYLAPTGTVLETVEVAALIGYSYMKIERPGAEATLKGVSYGVNIELPIRLLWDALPDLRLGGGGMVYHRDSESRSYGAHFGLRYDFKI